MSRFATGGLESSGCSIEHPRPTSGLSPVEAQWSGARIALGSKCAFRSRRQDLVPSTDRGVRPSRAADDASHECKAEAQRHSDLASKDEDHDGGGR